MSITNLTVPVPSDRVPEFYRWFADWVDRKPMSDGRASVAAPAEQELDAAVRWWNLLKPRELPGILSWPGRKGEKAGFEVRWSFRYDPISEEPFYGIEDAQYAELIRRACATAEAK